MVQTDASDYNQLAMCQQERQSLISYKKRHRKCRFPYIVNFILVLAVAPSGSNTTLQDTQCLTAHPPTLRTHISSEPQITVAPKFSNSFKNAVTIYDPEQEDSVHQLPDIINSNRVEIEGHTIGDNHWSKASSASFFSSIDRDGDGTLRRSELSNCLRDKIGGEEFDTNEEREQEIENVLTRLDLNKDDGLDEIDMTSYWKNNLDGLLGVEDVVEWIVNAVQLPDEVER